MSRSSRRSARRCARAWLSMVVVGGIAAVASASCGEAHSGVAERVLTGTVALSNEQTLVVDAVVEVVVEGTRRRDDITYRLDAVVTASAASAAERAADTIALRVERPAGQRTVQMTLPAPPMGTLGGRLTITAPSDLVLGVLQRASTVTITSMESDIEVQSQGSVQVADPKGSVSITVQAGNALVDSTLPAGERTVVSVRSGDIQLTIPPQVSAFIQASAGGGGAILVSHPQVPRPAGSLPYAVRVNGGLSAVELVTMRGNVVIRTP